MNEVSLETDRLLLRGWRNADFGPFADYFSSDATAGFVGGRCDRHTAWRRMATLIGHWALRGHGYWALEEKDSGEFAGSAGLWRPEGWPELELGYWLVPQAWGKGYATEAGAAARDYAFAQLSADTLVSYIHPNNHASVRVAQRLGASPDGVIELLSFGPHRVFRYPCPAA